jgi:hypothetical protein
MRYVDMRITPDRVQDATRAPIFEMECTTCTTLDAPDGSGSRSPASEDFEDVQMWALRHSGRHPGHTGYRETVTRFWRTSIVGEA